MENIRQQEIQKYEELIDKRMKPKLLHATAQSADLRRNIENLEKNSVTSLRTMVNIGSEVYVQAEVPNTQHIFVDIGMGFHVEFTWSEALNYIEKREERIARIFCLSSFATMKLTVIIGVQGFRFRVRGKAFEIS
ncbi:protein UXT [Trifolium pratense]|uniref:Protein UXT n=1 Tax=Trifolium pratense TaxID=57577 RepID=A0A2K3L399_TRIPR|nr:protein UXT [Trifolium pratense]